MSDSRRPRKRPSSRTASLRLIAASLMAAAAITGGLAVQMAHGRDPGLGSGSQQTAQPRTDGTAGTAAQDSSPPATVVTRAS